MLGDSHSQISIGDHVRVVAPANISTKRAVADKGKYRRHGIVCSHSLLETPLGYYRPIYHIRMFDRAYVHSASFMESEIVKASDRCRCSCCGALVDELFPMSVASHAEGYLCESCVLSVRASYELDPQDPFVRQATELIDNMLWKRDNPVEVAQPEQHMRLAPF